jgi:hypothetical protein
LGAGAGADTLRNSKGGVDFTITVTGSPGLKVFCCGMSGVLFNPFGPVNCILTMVGVAFTTDPCMDIVDI